MSDEIRDFACFYVTSELHCPCSARWRICPDAFRLLAYKQHSITRTAPVQSTVSRLHGASSLFQSLCFRRPTEGRRIPCSVERNPLGSCRLNYVFHLRVARSPKLLLLPGHTSSSAPDIDQSCLACFARYVSCFSNLKKNVSCFSNTWIA